MTGAESISKGCYHVPMDMNDFTLAAKQSLTLAHVEEALARWQQRPRTVAPTTITPREALTLLRNRMITNNVRVIRWIDLNRWQRHALSILYPRPVGYAWPGLPPG
ncbi:hypothetical protein AWB78_08050 [Caballeronia calidae]|uniref:Uncharacterized protein n=1 Tax=Caballeronia calidae TaxID=1777139 RepID=A0A158EHN7_9BURK|nr:hypothetical protein [Caballeronia calidae]SAL06399.1 hypothetical protein AWB78_08050 [Caballeronia calidae]